MKSFELLTKQAFEKAETKEYKQNVTMEMVYQIFTKMCEIEDKINYVYDYVKEQKHGSE